jgi:hypothetical protein
VNINMGSAEAMLRCESDENYELDLNGRSLSHWP